MNYEETKKYLKEKKLSHFKLFEDPNFEPNQVGILKSGDEYEVFVTSERGNPTGVKKFKSEEEALNNFISRVESLNRLIKKRPNAFL